jgi:hypothetical protein
MTISPARTVGVTTPCPVCGLPFTPPERRSKRRTLPGPTYGAP